MPPPAHSHGPPQQTVMPGTVDLNRAPPVSETLCFAGDAMCPGCDVVLISVCSLRADHLGAYGDTRQLTPNIDKLAETGTRFEQAYAGANFTLGSLATMLTGNFGSTTGVLNWGRGLPERYRTLPEVLGLFGYLTGGFSVDAATGFRPTTASTRASSAWRNRPTERHAGRSSLRWADRAGGATAAPLVGGLQSSQSLVRSSPCCMRARLTFLL